MAGGNPLQVESVAQKRPFQVKQTPVKSDVFVLTDEPVAGSVIVCQDTNGRGKWGAPAAMPGGKMYAYDNFT